MRRSTASWMGRAAGGVMAFAAAVAVAQPSAEDEARVAKVDAFFSHLHERGCST